DKLQGKLKSNVLVCPYHQWSYNASDGSLLKTSSKPNEDFDKSKYGLNKIQLKIWNGLIFINLSSKKSFSLKKVFQYFDKSISKIDISKFELGFTWTKEVKCNWKIYWENYSECLHCPNIHPELSKLVPLYQRKLVDVKDVENWKILKQNLDPKFHGGLRKGADTWSFDGSSQGHYIKDLQEEIHTKGQIYISSWPSMFLGIYGDHIRIVRILPLLNNKIQLTAEWLFQKETIEDPKYDIKNVTDFGILVMKQDADACELNQKGVYNYNNEKGVLMPEEYIVKDFQDWIRKSISFN
ncbi:aromatic ring-hydroxylating dioxygenase subunit alpha, partial [Alphaproteobacteria bacterium]|nr:aromatic ring-hydroxylating dioxygenase subunit alpha [Alphaproteobacteria bacterium]